jgi:hypothetical protein
MTKDPARRARCDVAAANVEIGAADGGFGKLDDGIGWRLEFWSRALLELNGANAFVD